MKNLISFAALALLVVLFSAFGFISTSYSIAGAPEIIIPSIHSSVISNGITSEGSTNWAGYVITGAAGSISDVKMSWVVPSVSCSFLSETYSAEWVGIDGAGTNTVEQIGTSSNCGLLGASYSAWYEFYPASSVSISGTVKAGDIISAQVSYSAGLYNVLITDHTENWSFHTAGTVSGSEDATAEWIVERPTLCDILGICSLSSLANFGEFYTGPKYTLLPSSQSDVATISGKTGSIASFSSAKGDSVYEVTMYSTNSPTYPLASPSSLVHGKSFTMTWDAAS